MEYVMGGVFKCMYCTIPYAFVFNFLQENEQCNDTQMKDD